MWAFSELKEMDIYNPVGEVIGQLSDIAFRKNGEITHLICQQKGVFGKKYCVPLEHIRVINEGIVISEFDESMKYCEDIGECTLFHHQSIHSKNVISQENMQLGLVDNVYLSNGLGKIIGYELTDGFFSDITDGKRKITVPFIQRIEEESVELFINKRSGE